ncbi:MAG: hypothetical protein MUO23_12475 [Anaerolineales bacterium]|nr:hypothetical protein [Anaerolineales bacterium]
MDLIQSPWTNGLFLLLAALAAWIVLRFLVRITGRLLRLGCLAAVAILGVVLALNAFV